MQRVKAMNNLEQATKPVAVRWGGMSMTALAGGLLLGLSGCLSDSDESGSFTLGVTDAPVEDAESVVVQFTGVEVHSEGGDTESFEFDEPRQIDLLALQGEASENLLEDEELPAGDYEWIRLNVDAERDVLDSYIELDNGEQHSLFIPSGAQSGLKLVSGFTMAAGGTADFTIDFDLRKSVFNPASEVSGQDYKLRPALRLVDNLEVGTIAGTVSSDWAGEDDCQGAVYVYEEHDAETGSLGSDDEPLASDSVEMDEDGQFVFEVAYLLEGDYTAAFTCQADMDDPGEENDIDFLETLNTTVEIDETTEIAFGEED